MDRALQSSLSAAAFHMAWCSQSRLSIVYTSYAMHRGHAWLCGWQQGMCNIAAIGVSLWVWFRRDNRILYPVLCRQLYWTSLRRGWIKFSLINLLKTPQGWGFTPFYHGALTLRKISKTFREIWIINVDILTGVQYWIYLKVTVSKAQ